MENKLLIFGMVPLKIANKNKEVFVTYWFRNIFVGLNFWNSYLDILTVQ